MLERLKKLIERIDELTLRERAVILAALLTLLFLGWYAYLIEPLKVTEKSLVSELERKRGQLQALNDQVTLMAEQQKKDPGAQARERLKQLREEEKLLSEELRGATANLVAPELMPEVLRSMLKSADGLTLISLRGLGSTPLLKASEATPPEKTAGSKSAEPAPQAAAQPPGVLDGAYKHGVQMEFTGDFFATLGFLRRLEALEWKFFWEAVTFDVNAYPQATATIRVFTLSLDQHWIGT
jgi:MSHA biogenesis protein MshJ